MDVGGFKVLFFLLGGAILAVVAIIVVVLVLAILRPLKRQGRRVFPEERIRLLKSIPGEISADAEKFQSPFLRGREGDLPFILVLAAEEPEGPYVVRLETPVDGRSFVEAWPRGSPFRPLRITSGVPEVATGDTAFDATWMVRADDPPHASAVLSPEFRSALVRLSKLGRGGRLRFDLQPLKALFQKEESIDDPELLKRFVGETLAALAILNRILADQAGVEFLDAAPKDGAAACPVCGATVAKGRVDCRRCRTPHHDECWEYFGACAVFGCGERGHVRA